MADVEIAYKGSTIATMDDSGTKTLLTNSTWCEDDITIQYTKSGGGGTAKTVNISLWIPRSASYFQSFTVYEMTDGVRGSQIGSIATADGSTTVTVSASANGIECLCIGDYVSPPTYLSAYHMSGAIGLEYVGEGNALIDFSVASSGSIEIQDIDWSD